MGKIDANECNESLLSNCRVQLALSKKKDGMILEKPPFGQRETEGFEKTFFNGKEGRVGFRKKVRKVSVP